VTPFSGRQRVKLFFKWVTKFLLCDNRTKRNRGNSETAKKFFRSLISTKLDRLLEDSVILERFWQNLDFAAREFHLCGGITFFAEDSWITLFLLPKTHSGVPRGSKKILDSTEGFVVKLDPVLRGHQRFKIFLISFDFCARPGSVLVSQCLLFSSSKNSVIDAQIDSKCSILLDFYRISTEFQSKRQFFEAMTKETINVTLLNTPL